MNANFRKVLITGTLLLLVMILILFFLRNNLYQPVKPIRIGVIQSLTGTMAVSGKPLVDAVRLAVEEINTNGGLLGRPVELIVADGKLNLTVFAEEATRLIEKENVSVLLACWTSSCRKTLKSIVEKHNHLLIYPLQYEGLEESPNILYTGAAPNQQIIPGTMWALNKFGSRVYLVGSDYIFPKVANQIIRDIIHSNNGKILGESYLCFEEYACAHSEHLARIITEIKNKKPNVILNTLNGEINAAFFTALIQAGLAHIPIVSFSVAEGEMKAWGGNQLTQHYSVWNYFQSIQREENIKFIRAFQNRFGKDRIITDPMEASYIGVHLWAQAVQSENSADPLLVNDNTLLRQSFAGPSEIVSVDATTRHLWKMVRIGKVKPDSQFELVYNSEYPLKPTPWPIYRTKEEWLNVLKKIKKKMNYHDPQ